MENRQIKIGSKQCKAKRVCIPPVCVGIARTKYRWRLSICQQGVDITGIVIGNEYGQEIK
jgi:hypothetical protein